MPCRHLRSSVVHAPIKPVSEPRLGHGSYVAHRSCGKVARRDQAYGAVAAVTPQEVAPRLTDNGDEVHGLGVPEYSSVRLLGLLPGALELPEGGHVVVHDVAPALPLFAFRLSGVQTQCTS